jgi:hypothetical protein
MELGRAITRRAALRLGGATGLALATSGTGSALARVLPADPAKVWARSSYTPLVGQAFSVKGASRRLKLVAISDLTKQSAGSEDAFALVFHAIAGTTVDDMAPATFSHASIGSFPLSVIPGTTATGMASFTAVINRLYG